MFGTPVGQIAPLLPQFARPPQRFFRLFLFHCTSETYRCCSYYLNPRYFSIVVAILFLAVSVTFAILFILPRKGKYKTIASMELWQKWRKDYNEYLKQSGNQAEKLDDALLHEITDKLAEAQANNAPINEKRRQYFYHCVLMAALGIIPLSLQAFFYLLLKLRGI